MSVLTVLGIDTSGKTASAAVADDNALLAVNTVLTKLTHSQTILPMVKKLLTDAGKTFSDIDVVAVADGPGSYTGLRIGIAAVKGICFAKDIKCLGVSTLMALAQNAASSEKTIFSCMKARDGVAYFGIYKSDGQTVSPLLEDTVCGLDKVKEIRRDFGKVVLVGDYAAHIKNEIFKSDGEVFTAPVTDRLQNAASLCGIALKAKKLCSPDELNARYLQLTKAERDRRNIE